MAGKGLKAAGKAAAPHLKELAKATGEGLKKGTVKGAQGLKDLIKKFVNYLFYLIFSSNKVVFDYMD